MSYTKNQNFITQTYFSVTPTVTPRIFNNIEFNTYAENWKRMVKSKLF